MTTKTWAFASFVCAGMLGGMTVAEQVDSDFVAAARQALHRGESLRMVLPGGAEVVLEGVAARAVVDLLSGRPARETQELPEVLTTGQAADLLGVSRPTVVKLVDDGFIPAERVGSHRRLRTADVLAHLERAAVARHSALDEVTRISEELGLYE